MILDDYNTVQPDILFVSNANRGILQHHAVVGPPDLVIEILSPSTGRWDRYDKRALYERFGVRECWLVDPANRTIEVLRLNGSN